MSRKKKIVALVSGTLVLLVIFILFLIFLFPKFTKNETSNSDNNLVSTPVSSYLTSYGVDGEPSQQNYNRIENYISGGSSFYCPTNPTICEKIQNYYTNINNKDFQEAYKYGKKLRSYDSLVSTYSNYLIVSASFIREQSNGSYIAYVTLINENKELDLYHVLITADENSILSSDPITVGNVFDLDCNYIDLSSKNVCVFKIEATGELANLIANSFFYKPQYYKGAELNQNEKVFYSYGVDGLGSWAVIYKYNYETKVLSYIDSINYVHFPDVDNICTGKINIDLSTGGCAEKYLLKEQIEMDREYVDAVKTYQLDI